MKKFQLLFCLLLVPMVASAQDVWQTKYAEIEKSIQAPAFKGKLYKITKFGASTKASAAVNQKGINAAIEKCSRDGGGKVVVPAFDVPSVGRIARLEDPSGAGFYVMTPSPQG